MEKHRYVLQVLRVEFEEHLTSPSDLIYTNVTHYQDNIPQSINSDYASYQGKTSFAWNTNEFILHIDPCSCHNSSLRDLKASYPNSSPITFKDILSNHRTDDPQLISLLTGMKFITVEFKRTAGSALLTQQPLRQSNPNVNEDYSLGSFFLSTHDRIGLQIFHLYNSNLHHVGRVIVLWYPMLPQMLLSLPTYQQPERKFFFAEGDSHKKYTQRRHLLASFLKLLFKPTFAEDSDVYQDYWEELHCLAKDLQDLDFRAMFLEQLTPLEYQSLKALATGSSLALLKEEMNSKKDKNSKENKDSSSADLHGLDDNPPYHTHPSITSVFLTFLNMCLNLCSQTRDFAAVYHILQISSNFSYNATVLSALKGNTVGGKSHTNFLCNAYSITKSHQISRSQNLWNFIYLESIKLCDALYTTDDGTTSALTPTTTIAATASIGTHDIQKQLFKHLFWARRLGHVSQTPHRQSAPNLTLRRDDYAPTSHSDACPYQKLYLHLSAKYTSQNPLDSTNATTVNAENDPLVLSFAGDDLDEEKPSFMQNVQYRLAHHFSTIHGTPSPTTSSTSTKSVTTGVIEDGQQFRHQFEHLLHVSPKEKDKFLIIQLLICTLVSIGQDTQQVIAFILGLGLDKQFQRIVIAWWDTQQLIIETYLPDRALYKDLKDTGDERWVHCRSTFGLPQGTEPSTELYPTQAKFHGLVSPDFWVQKQSTPTTTLVNSTLKSSSATVLTGNLHPSGSNSHISHNNVMNLAVPQPPKLDWGKEPKRPLPIHVSLVPPPDWTHYNEYISSQHQARLGRRTFDNPNTPSNRTFSTFHSSQYQGHSHGEIPPQAHNDPPIGTLSTSTVSPVITPLNTSPAASLPDYDNVPQIKDTNNLSRPETASSVSSGDTHFDDEDYDSYYEDNGTDCDLETPEPSIGSYTGLGEAPKLILDENEDDESFGFDLSETSTMDIPPPILPGDISPLVTNNVSPNLTPSPPSEEETDDDDFVDISQSGSTTQNTFSPPTQLFPTTPTRPKSLSVNTIPGYMNNVSQSDSYESSVTPTNQGRPVPPTPSRIAPPIPIRSPSLARPLPSHLPNTKQNSTVPASVFAAAMAAGAPSGSTPPLILAPTAQVVPLAQPTPGITTLTSRTNGQKVKTSSVVYNPVFTSMAMRRHIESVDFFTNELISPLTNLGLPEVGELIQDNSYSSLPGPIHRRNALSSRVRTMQQSSRNQTSANVTMDQSMMSSEQQLALGGNGWTRIPFEFMHGETSLLNLDVYCLDMPSILHYATRPRRHGPSPDPNLAVNVANPSNSPQLGSAVVAKQLSLTSHKPAPLSLPSLPQTPYTALPAIPLSPVLAPVDSSHPPHAFAIHHPSSPSSNSQNGNEQVRWFPSLPVHHVDNMHISFSISNNFQVPASSSLSYPRDIMMPTSVSTTQDHPHIEPDLEITVSNLQRVLDDAVSRGRLTLTNYRLVYSPYVYLSNTHNGLNTTTPNNDTLLSAVNNPHQHLFTEWIDPGNQPTHCNEPNCSRCIESRCRRVFGTIPLQSIHRLEHIDAHEAKAKSFQLSVLDEFKKIDQSKHFQQLPEHQQVALTRNISTLGGIPPGSTIKRNNNSTNKEDGSLVSFFSPPSSSQSAILPTTAPLHNRPAPALPTDPSQPPQLTALTRVSSSNTSYSNSLSAHQALQGTGGGLHIPNPNQTPVNDLHSVADAPLTSDILFRLITQWCMGPQRNALDAHGSTIAEESTNSSAHSDPHSALHSTTVSHSVAGTTVIGKDHTIQTSHHYGNESLLHIRCKDSRQVTFCIKHAQLGRSPQQLWAHFRHQMRQVAYTKPWESIRDSGPRCPPHVIEMAKRIESLSPSSLKSLSQFFHLYAFVLSSNKGKESNGWDVYQPRLEYQRQGCFESGDFIQFDNTAYQLCQTYPQLLMFQWRTRTHNIHHHKQIQQASSTISTREMDEMLNTILPKSAKYRSKGRLPTVTFYHATTGGTILRSAQPLPGITNSRSSQDQDLCNRASISIIFDARPKANAQANKMKGGGFEPKPELYNSQLLFCDIENIHKMRAALKSITTICREACPHVLVSNSHDAGIIHSAMIFQHAARIVATAEAHQKQLLAQQKAAAATSSNTTTTTSGPATPPFSAKSSTNSATLQARQESQNKSRRSSFASSSTVSHSNLYNYTGVAQPSKQLYIPSATDLIARCGVKTLPERYGQLVDSEWAGHVTGLLRTSRNIAQHTLDGKSCLVRCSDGWDRTAQMCCLAQIMLDPYFRTIQGFAVLIEKDFLSFGHKFSDRCGHADPDHANVERSPIFIQFLDAVFQLLVQNPASFEFDDTLLHYLATHTYSCKYGTFLFNNHRERHHLIQAHLRTVSIWDVVICKHKKKFINPLYEPTLSPALQHVFPALTVSGTDPSRDRCCDRSLTEIAEQSSLLWVDAPWSPWNFYFRWDLRTCYEYKV
jgi:hypothetical protein